MSQNLTRQQSSDAITGLGWRYVFGAARTCVRVTSLAQAATVAERVAAAAGRDADGHVRMDLRPDQVAVVVQTRATVSMTARDVEVVRRVSAAVDELGLRTDPGVDPPAGDGGGGGATRSAQAIELAIDALDIGAIRPFWQAVLGYQDETAASGDEDPIADPAGAGPTIWFQQMDAPRTERNRIHFDVAVPHDEAATRIAATLAAGGKVTYDAEAPAFWVLADAEGNEACVCTWEGRD